jgi:hypothetical protein
MEKEFKKMMDDSLKNAFDRMGTDYDPVAKNTELNKLRGDVVSEDELEGGDADEMTIEKLAKKHKTKVENIINQLMKGIAVEREHTNEVNLAMEIAMDHVAEDPKYYDKLEKIESHKEESKEATGAASAGAYVGPLFGPIKKSKNTPTKTKPKGGEVGEGEKYKEETKEATTSASVGAYDAPFGGPKKDPLKLSNPDTVEKELRSTKPGFPKFGGPGGKYVRIKDKCKKFPYCNQGDINALELFEKDMVKEAIENISLRLDLPMIAVKSIVLHELEEKLIKEQDDNFETVTFELPDDYKPKSAEEHRKEFIDEVPDKKAQLLLKKFDNYKFDFNGRDLSGKGTITGIGPVGNVGFLSSADGYKFNQYGQVEIHVELDDLNYKGQKVPLGFYDMISRYLPPEEEEDSYRGDPVESAVLTGLDGLNDVLKYTGLRLRTIRINPYGHLRG